MFSLLKKKWKEYTIELFLVMLGIIIPFLIYKINDNRHQKEQEKQYSLMLLLDLNEDLKILKSNYDSIVDDQIYIYQNSYHSILINRRPLMKKISKTLYQGL